MVGIADLSSVKGSKWKTGISIIISIDKRVVESIQNGPTIDYYNEYYRLNNKLDEIAEKGAKFIIKRGYEAIAQTREYVQEYDLYRTEMPHKTVATIAGLGWIGKSALLVTKEFGPAVRLTSILTDMPMVYDKAIKSSQCEDCNLCTANCPGQAIKGINWDRTLERDKFFDVLKCRKTARELSRKRIDQEITLCGKCIVVCPYTQRYLKEEAI